MYQKLLNLGEFLVDSLVGCYRWVNGLALTQVNRRPQLLGQGSTCDWWSERVEQRIGQVVPRGIGNANS